MCSSLRRSFLFPTKMMGTLGQKCLTSGVHFSGMFSVKEKDQEQINQLWPEIYHFIKSLCVCMSEILLVLRLQFNAGSMTIEVVKSFFSFKITFPATGGH